MSSKKSIAVFAAALCFVIVLTTVRNYDRASTNFVSSFTQRQLFPPPPLETSLVQTQQCRVLDEMTRGRWKTRPLSQEENNHMFQFLKRVRHDFKFPPNYQRSDGRCGNISTYEPGVTAKYRAVCDPQGATPCCFNYRCAYKSVEECKCENCFDIRNMKHAEYSSWIPSNPACVYDTHSPQRACRILKGLNIAFVGDSLIRNLYTALLLLVTGNMKDGAMKTNVGKDVRKNCSDWHAFLGKSCRFYVDDDVKLCGANVNLKGFFYYNSTFWREFGKNIGWTKTSLIVTGIGIHNSYDEKIVKRVFVEKMKNNIEKMKAKPRFLWAAPHAPGILKSPTYINQTHEKVKRYNAKMKPYLESLNIPILDTFDMTDGMMSIDGQHYGIGMNLVKANIFLRYIEQARREQNW